MAKKTHKKPTYKNYDSLSNKHIIAILNSPHCTGQDGQDYMPYKEELEQVLWSRSEKATIEAHKQYEREQREYAKHLAMEAKKAKKALKGNK